MTQTMTSAERFFWKHAGYNYDPKTETKAQGRRRCAEALAKADTFASNLGLHFEWSEDWSCDHEKEFGYRPETCESCVCWDVTGKEVLASLGCIDDASPEYRRVIQAELALEAVAQFDEEIAVLDAH